MAKNPMKSAPQLEETYIVVVDKDYRITFPVEMRHKNNIEAGDQMEFIAAGSNIVMLLPPVNKRPRAYKRILRHAIDLFNGNAEAALLLLHTPQFGLDQQLPVDVMKTTKGAREVRDLIGRINHGEVA